MGSRRRRPGIEDKPRRSTPFICRPLGGISGAICSTYDARFQLRVCLRSSSPPSIPSLILPRWDCNDRPAPSLAFRIPPPPADPDPDRGVAATPEGPNSASSLSRGASNLSPSRGQHETITIGDTGGGGRRHHQRAGVAARVHLGAVPCKPIVPRERLLRQTKSLGAARSRFHSFCPPSCNLPPLQCDLGMMAWRRR